MKILKKGDDAKKKRKQIFLILGIQNLKPLVLEISYLDMYSDKRGHYKRILINPDKNKVIFKKKMEYATDLCLMLTFFAFIFLNIWT